MGLFLISALCIAFSSYYFSAILAKEKQSKNILGFMYFFICAFAQIVVSFEILSICHAIKQVPFLVFNFIFLGIGYLLWYKTNKPTWSINIPFKSILNAIKLDKSLIALFIGWLVLISSAILLCSIMPLTNYDAEDYHVSRSVLWILNNSINGITAADSRILDFPINSELLYTWLILFLKDAKFLGFFGFIGYILSIVSIYNLASKYSVRKKLWAIFMVSALPSVIVQLSGTETDILISGLVLSSVYLFRHYLRNKNTSVLYMSALAYALAIGTKTPAIFAIPGLAILYLIWMKQYKANIIKTSGLFLGFGIINFILVSSYIYILNYISYGNIIGSVCTIAVHKNFYGIKGAIAGFVKNMFLMLDFTGFRWGDFFQPEITGAKDAILKFLQVDYIKDGTNSNKVILVNRTLIEPCMGAGILGFLLFIPCTITAIIKSLIQKTKKNILNGYLGFMFFLNMAIMSFFIVYMSYNVRFIMFFIMLSSLVFVCSYMKKMNIIKGILVIFAIFNLAFISTHLWARPVVKCLKYIKNGETIEDIQNRAENQYFSKEDSIAAHIVLRDFLLNFDLNNKIIMFPSTPERIYKFGILSLKYGYKIDYGVLNTFKDFDKYDILVTPYPSQSISTLKNWSPSDINYEVSDKDGALKINQDENKEGILCTYITQGKPLEKGTTQLPENLTCAIPNNYFEKQGFEEFAQITNNATDTIKYIIYTKK